MLYMYAFPTGELIISEVNSKSKMNGNNKDSIEPVQAGWYPLIKNLLRNGAKRYGS